MLFRSDWWKNRKIIIATTNECIDKCKEDYQFLFDYKCFYRCPKDTYSDNYVCKKIGDNNTDDADCTIKDYFLTNCKLDLNNNTEKQKFIEKTVSGFINMELYDLSLQAIENRAIISRKTDKEAFTIYALSNKIRNDDLAYVNLNECGEILKQKYNIPNDELIVFKIEYYSPNYKIPIIEYNIFGRGGKIKMNLNYCKSLKATYYIPKNLTDYEDFLYNPDNKYYIDKCYSYTTEKNIDLILYDRKNEFNINNMSLCESTCTFKGYRDNIIECECEIKLKFNSFLNVNSDKYNIIKRFENEKMKKSFNVWVIKCFMNYLSFETLTSNLICFILLGIIFIILLGAIIFCLKEKKSFYGKIERFLQGISLNLELEGSAIHFEKSIGLRKNSNETGKPLKQKIINFKDNTLNKMNKKGKSKLKGDKSNKSEIIEDDGSHNIFTSNEGTAKNTIKGKNKNRNITKTKNEKKPLEQTDNELNFSSYKNAIINDKRSFCNYYLSLIRTKHLLVFPFSRKNDFNSRSMKICFLFLILGINITIVILFLDESNFHEIYISDGAFDIMFHLPKIIYATVVSLVIKNSLLWTIFTEKHFLDKKEKIIKGKFDKRNREMACISIKVACFFPLSILLLTLFLFYIICFGSVFKIHIFIF